MSKKTRSNEQVYDPTDPPPDWHMDKPPQIRDSPPVEDPAVVAADVYADAPHPLAAEQVVDDDHTQIHIATGCHADGSTWMRLTNKISGAISTAYLGADGKVTSIINHDRVPEYATDDPSTNALIEPLEAGSA